MKLPQSQALKDINVLSTVAIILAFLFAYNDSRAVFNFELWFGDFLVILGLIVMSLCVHEGVRRYIAYKKDAVISLNLWWPGLILAVLFALVSGGKLFFAAIWTVSIGAIHIYRPGRPTKRAHIGPYESAWIAAAGPLVSLGLAVIFSLFIGNSLAEKLVNINIWLALSHMIPLASILAIALRRAKPIIGLPGDLIFFGSRPLWAFLFSFVLISGLGLVYFGALASTILAFILGLIIWVVWHYYVEGAKPGPF